MFFFSLHRAQKAAPRFTTFSFPEVRASVSHFLPTPYRLYTYCLLVYMRLYVVEYTSFACICSIVRVLWIFFFSHWNIVVMIWYGYLIFMLTQWSCYWFSSSFKVNKVMIIKMCTIIAFLPKGSKILLRNLVEIVGDSWWFDGMLVVWKFIDYVIYSRLCTLWFRV